MGRTVQFIMITKGFTNGALRGRGLSPWQANTAKDSDGRVISDQL